MSISLSSLFPINPSVGVNQTWSVVTGSRVTSTTYTNSTGSPIMVNVGKAGLNTNLALIVGGVQVASCSGPVSSADGQTISGIVPDGSTYSTTGPFVAWAELR
jgi:hypothetical protein